MAQDHGRLLELLRTASPDSVVAFVKSLRGAESQSSHQLSDLRVGLAPAHPPLHWDLNFRYPNAFSDLDPSHAVDVDFRLIDVNKPSSTTTRKAQKRLRHGGPWAATKLASQQSPRSELSYIVTRPPSAQSIHYADSRLHNLNIGRWTSVSISNAFAAEAISFYLSNEHPFLALFDSDLFLEDLITGKGQFCTELLVSSLLAWSCASYAQFDAEAKRLSPIFFDEGKLRWDANCTHAADLCTVSAAVLLAMTCNQHGKDRVGLIYLDASAEIALELGLFDCIDEKTKRIRFEDKNVASAASYVAWGTFAWHTIWYHTVILDVWRSFLPRNRKGNLQSFSSPDNTPVAAYNASIQQLKRLVYQFRKSFEATNLTILVTPGYLYLVNEVFRNSPASDAQFYFLLSTHGCLAIGPWCRGVSGTAKAFMSFGDRMGIFDQAEWTSGLIETVRMAIEELDRNEMYSSLYPIDLAVDHDGIKSGNMEVLAKEFANFTVQGDLPHKEPQQRRIEEQPHEQQEEEQQQFQVWKGDPRDLSLTLSEVAGVDGKEWDGSALGRVLTK
ncbi:hypothetical protein E4U55_004142 [Claviceps digitariae]|nr:hypothetical protein E4U55_004142 [Claviceps digitariae]